MSCGTIINSPVARRARRQTLDRVFPDQLRPKVGLRDRRAIAHREDLVAWADKLLRGTVALDAPLHLQGILLEHQRHLIDTPVTRLAPHALLHVNAVIEVDEVRQVVHARPVQRAVLTQARADRLEDRTCDSQLGVAIHAGLRWGDPGKGRRLN